MFKHYLSIFVGDLVEKGGTYLSALAHLTSCTVSVGYGPLFAQGRGLLHERAHELHGLVADACTPRAH